MTDLKVRGVIFSGVLLRPLPSLRGYQLRRERGGKAPLPVGAGVCLVPGAQGCGGQRPLSQAAVSASQCTIRLTISMSHCFSDISSVVEHSSLDRERLALSGLLSPLF